jgi:hypothetical protein
MLAAVFGAVKKLISFSKRRDIKEMQEKYEAKKEKKIKVILTDMSRAIVFKVMDGKLNYMLKGAEDMEGDVEAYMDAATLLNLLSGRMKVLNHATGKKEFKPYRYFDAVRWGDVKVDGDMAANDNQLAMRVFDDCIQDMQAELFPEVQAELEGDDDE